MSAVTGMVGLADGADLGQGALLTSLGLWVSGPLLLAAAIFHRKEI